jgi:hypothetical protein
MHTCPHCQQKGISTLQKLTSVSFAPAVCQLCSKPSYLHVLHGLYALIIWIMLTWVFIGVALFLKMSIFLIGTVPALFLAVDMYMLKAPLRCA